MAVNRYTVGPWPDRFWEKVSPEPMTGCWLWTGSKPGRAWYGSTHVPGGHQRQAHRVAWELLRGPIPEGLFACHRCDQPLCVNPDHIFLGTHTENMADMRAKGRAHGKTGTRATCRRGHPRTPGGTYRTPGGKVECRVCRTIYFKRRWEITCSTSSR